MREIYNIYCDESCHLENDGLPVMVLGAIWHPLSKRKEITKRLNEIKIKHGLSQTFEVKWTKVSKSKIEFYLDLIDYFFDDDDLHFRALVVSDKTQLSHKSFNQDHDDWYYKMYFRTLSTILTPEEKFRIYLDIKDTRGGEKIKKLHEVLCNNIYDFSRSIVKTVQLIRSEEIPQIQLADLLIGAVGYENRKKVHPREYILSNKGKSALVDRIKERSKYSLLKSTLLRESKFNIFHWQGQKFYG